MRHVGRVVQDGLGGWEWDGVRVAIGVGDGSADDTEEWDELCAEAGMEFVQVDNSGSGGGRESMLQEFGGSLKALTQDTLKPPPKVTNLLTWFTFTDKSGFPRVKEALQENDWEQADVPFGDDNTNAETSTQEHQTSQDSEVIDPESLDFGIGQADMDTLRKAILAGVAKEHGSGAAEGQEEEEGEEDADDEIDEDDVAKVEKMMRKLQAAREAGQAMGEAQRRRMAARAVEEVMKDW